MLQKYKESLVKTNKLNYSKAHKRITKKDRSLKFEIKIIRAKENTLFQKTIPSGSSLEVVRSLLTVRRDAIFQYGTSILQASLFCLATLLRVQAVTKTSV